MAGFALHVGLNAVDPRHYDGWSGELQACENDMRDMAEIARQAGFPAPTRLATRAATRRAVLSAIEAIAGQATAGDLVLVTYSGHGGQVPDLGGDESRDRLDETWCLYDGQLLDDELLLLWAGFREGVRILIVSDSCHSGGMEKFTFELRLEKFAQANVRPRLMPPGVARQTYLKNQKFYDELQKDTDRKIAAITNGAREAALVCSMRLLSACAEFELSYEDGANGYFTNAVVDAWDYGRFAGDYQTFYRLVSRLVPPQQAPQHKPFGRRSAAYDRQKPFEI